MGLIQGMFKVVLSSVVNLLDLTMIVRGIAMQFSGICLVTEDVAALVRFYTPIFGCQAEGDNIHAEFHVGGLNLAVFSRAGMEEMASGSMRGAGSGNVTIAFEVENADVEYERLVTLGVEIIKPPQSHPWGARAFWFRDPDGNIVDFFSRV